MSTPSKKEEILKELYKCGKDPIYFLNTYAKIKHKQKGILPFKTWDFQDKVIKDFIDHEFNIILKSRQLGISTVSAGYVAWLMLFNQSKMVMVIATKQEVAKNFVTKVKVILELLPPWFQKVAKVVVNNETSLRLSNYSELKSSTTAADAGRSEGLSLLIIDEAAHIENMDEIWIALKPTISGGGRVIALSSPNGASGWFYNTYTKAEQGENDFNPIKLMWDVHPERDQAWFDKEVKTESPRFIAQEYCCFAGETLVATENGFKEIKDIKIGDKVLTHKGRFKKVEFVNKKMSNDYYEVKTFFNRNVARLTGNHRLLLENNSWKEIENIEDAFVCSQPKNIIFDEQEKLLDLSKIIKLDDFKLKIEDDKIFINDRRHKTHHNRFVRVDYDLGKLLGLFLAEGHKGKNYVCFSFNYSTELNTWVADLIKIVKGKFGINSFKITNREKSCGMIQFNSTILSNFINLFISGRCSLDKQLSSISYENSNRNFLKGVLDGVFLGDGCCIKKYPKTLAITSRKLIYDVKFISMILGFPFSSLRENKKVKKGKILGRDVNLNNSYVFKFLRSTNVEIGVVSDLLERELKQNSSCYDGKYKENNSYSLTKLIDKKLIKEQIEVFNLQVEEDESYTTEHFVAHNCSFVGSGRTVIEGEKIVLLEHRAQDPIYTSGDDGNIWVFEDPEQDVDYFLVADVARGDGEDYSTFHIFKKSNLEQVAEYRGKVKADEFAPLIYDVAKIYGNCLVVVENNVIGLEVANLLAKMDYENLYYQDKRTREYLPPHMVRDNEYALAGFAVQDKNIRDKLIVSFENTVRNDRIIIKSKRLINEIQTFVWTLRGKAEASKGKHDDLVMPCAIACFLKDTLFTDDEDRQGATILNSALFFSKSVVKFNTAVPGMDNFNNDSAFKGINSPKTLSEKYRPLMIYKG